MIAATWLSAAQPAATLTEMHMQECCTADCTLARTQSIRCMHETGSKCTEVIVAGPRRHAARSGVCARAHGRRAG